MPETVGDMTIDCNAVLCTSSMADACGPSVGNQVLRIGMAWLKLVGLCFAFLFLLSSSPRSLSRSLSSPLLSSPILPLRPGACCSPILTLIRWSGSPSSLTLVLQAYVAREYSFVLAKTTSYSPLDSLFTMHIHILMTLIVAATSAAWALPHGGAVPSIHKRLVKQQSDADRESLMAAMPAVNNGDFKKKKKRYMIPNAAMTDEIPQVANTDFKKRHLETRSAGFYQSAYHIKLNRGHQASENKVKRGELHPLLYYTQHLNHALSRKSLTGFTSRKRSELRQTLRFEAEARMRKRWDSIHAAEGLTAPALRLGKRGRLVCVLGRIPLLCRLIHVNRRAFSEIRTCLGSTGAWLALLKPATMQMLQARLDRLLAKALTQTSSLPLLRALMSNLKVVSHVTSCKEKHANTNFISCLD